MKSIIQYFLKSSISGNLLMAFILIFGVLGLQNLRSRFFPESPERFIKIQVAYPGASPEEMEEGIVLKIEDNLEGVTGLERVTSVSSENTAAITVEIESGFDIDLVLQDVKNAVEQISSFPTGIEPPVIAKQENLDFAYSFALQGDVPLKTLKEFARKVEDELRNTGFISKVTLSGFPDEEIEVAFREDDLRAYQITFEQAAAAVAGANIELTGGKLKSQDEELLIRARSKGYYAEDLRNIVVKTTPNGGIIRLHQLADIQDLWADNPSRSFLNGQPSVNVRIDCTSEEDILKTTDFMGGYIETFNAENDIVRAVEIRDRSINLRERIDLLSENGIIGFLLVLVFLALFLNWEIAFWVALSIPISFAGMLFVGSLLGITINVISLFGMIIVIGILVDDGIVISENIFQHYEAGASASQAALEGVLEVLPAVVSAITTTVLAFSTFYFIDGNLGDFFQEMATVVIFTLIFSLVEGVLILPAHIMHTRIMHRDKKPRLIDRVMNTITQYFDKFMCFLRDTIYAPVLKFCITGLQRAVPLTALLAGFLITLGAISGGYIGTTFFPFIERDEIAVNLKMPAGTREHITNEWLIHIEKAAWAVNEDFKANLPEGQNLIQRIEKQLGPSTYTGNLEIQLLSGDKRGVSVLDVQNAIREKAGPIIGAETLTYGGASVFGKPVSVSLLGNNLKQLDAAVARLKDSLATIDGLKDIVDSNQEGLREINIALTPKARQLNLDIRQVIAQVRAGFFGQEVQRLQRGEDEVKVWVRYALQDRNNIGQLENMRIRFADGREFPLSEIANLEIKRGIVQINHLDGKREVKVEADIESTDVPIAAITQRLKTTVVPTILADFPEVLPMFEGQNREQQKTSSSLATVGPVILLLMFAVIALTFRSVGQTVTVFLLLPFGFIGVGLGHYLLDAPISLFSGLGIIALIGIMVNDALVFVAAYNTFIQKGQTQMDAIYNAGMSRFRPIVLTSVTTAAGLGPLILETSFQAQFLIPMAISIAFGLIIVTLVILLLLPVLLVLVNRYKILAIQIFQGEKPAYVEVEPAYSAIGTRKAPYSIWLLGLGALIGIVLILTSIL